LPRDKQIIMHCHLGVRSATSLSIVKNAGFIDATHVEGGVHAWAKHIDPTCAVY
jgi:adenylyltransferase/sulfurtransferase